MSGASELADSLKPLLRRKAEELGFAALRVAAAGPAPHAREFFEWLDGGNAADMEWLRRNAEKRADPNRVLPGVRSVVVLAVNYWQGDPGDSAATAATGRVARYAWGDDYHDWLLQRMRPLEELLERAGGTQKAYVDTGPVLERDFAALAGAGWHGKSTMLINRQLGTWFFLAEILTTLELEPDAPENDHCGRCTRCIDACPTAAITAPYRLDARRCIAYLTIENKGPIPESFRAAIGNRIFGCDDCLDACPWNRFARVSSEAVFHARAGTRGMLLRDYLGLDAAAFRTMFRGSPILRIKRERFLRNVCVALGNTGGPDDVPALEAAAREASPLIAEHARWALARLRERQEC